MTTGSNNILMGYRAGDALTSGSNNIVIGYDIDAPSATGNNQIVLGATDLFYGDLTNKRIGIGTTTPGQKLTVDGTFGILEGGTSSTFHSVFQGGDQSTNITYTLPTAVATANGQALVSTTGGVLSWSSPELPLTFQNGLTRATNTIKLGGALTENTTITQDAAETFTIANSGTENTTVNLASTGDFQIQDNGTAFFTATDGGRIGIGVSAPSQQLELSGNLSLDTTTTTTGSIFARGQLFIHNYGAYNTFLGERAGNRAMTGGYNAAVGAMALENNTTGSDNTAMGFTTLYNNQAGGDNTGIGYGSLFFNSDGSENTALGSSTLYHNYHGSQNTVVGTKAGMGTWGQSYSYNSLFGYEAGYSLSTGSRNILIGYRAGVYLSSGSYNIIIGYNIDAPSATGNNQVVLGATDLFYGDLTNKKIGIGTTTPAQKLTVDGTFGILEGGTSPASHTIFQGGSQSGDIVYTLPTAAATADGQALTSTTLGILSWSSPELPLTFDNGLTRSANAVKLGGNLTANTTITQDAAETFTLANSGSGNTVVNLASTGDFQIQDNGTAFFTATDGGRIGIGISAPNEQLELTGNLRLPTTTATTGIIYAGTLPLIHNFGTYNNFFGQNCGNLTLSGANENSAIGDSALLSLTTGDRNLAFGQGALKSVTTSIGNIAIGYRAGKNIVDASGYNTIIGYQAGITSNTDRNTFLGCETGYATTTGHFDVFVGHQAGYANTTGNNSVAVGYRALYTQTGNATDNELNNTAIGFEALRNNNPEQSWDGRNNVAVGYYASRSNTTGYLNTSIGSSALTANTSGNFNVGIGANAMAANTGGTENTGIGYLSLAENQNGFRNTAVGTSALEHTSGNYNTAVGVYAGRANSTGNYNTALGYMASTSPGTVENTIAIGYFATANSSNQVRLGNADITSLYCMGAYDGLVGGTNRLLYADNTGKIGYFASSARYKENILDMENIDWLFRLRPVNFSYKSDEKKIKQYGLIAEEVEKVNPAFVSYNKDGMVETVSYSLLISPMIKAMQEQQKTISTLQSQVDEMKKDREQMLKNQEILMSRLEALEKKK